MSTAIGIDIGGTNVRCGLVTPDGSVTGWVAEPTAASPADVLRQVIALARDLRRNDTVGLGIGMPGRVDTSKGVALSGGYVDFRNVPVVSDLRMALGLPVVAENDGTMALIAEAGAGAAQGVGDIVMLTIGTGIGGAAMLNGRVVRGTATAGQLGHITVDADNGLLCACGRRGCVETRSSGTALTRLMTEAGLAKGTRAEDLLARRSQDAVAERILDDWVKPLRFAIDSLVAVLAPECVLLGGGLGGLACEALQAFPEVSGWFRCKILPARLGERAGVIGAGLRALDAGRYNP